MHRIDVIVPCYNYARYLRGCVQSVLRQEGVQVRVLIIDDFSPDHTPEVGRALAEEDSRVEYRRHPQNARHIATYNEGFEWAAGGATLRLSADDLLTPGALFRALRAAQERYAAGERSGEALRLAMRQVLDAEPLARIEYVSVADPLTLQELDEVQAEGALLSLAVRFGKTRLIDNVLLGL